jgi:hypothetical protein
MLTEVDLHNYVVARFQRSGVFYCSRSSHEMKKLSMLSK